MIAWFYVVVAGLFEVVWATSMKSTEGWTRLWPSVFTVGAMIVSFLLLAQGMRSLPVGVAYAVWVGIGAIGAAAAASVVLGERLTAAQWACIAIIAAGIIGLRLVTPPEAQPPHRATPGAPS